MRASRRQASEIIARHVADRVRELIDSGQLAEGVPVNDVVERLVQEAQAQALASGIATVAQMRAERDRGHGDGPSSPSRST